MQKYEYYVHDFLIQNNDLSLEKIGHLKLAEGNSLQFTFDRKATTSPEFVAFVAEKTGKNKTLVMYDVESHLENARQFINLGKPYVIPNLGGISLHRSGNYVYEKQQQISISDDEFVTEQAAELSEKDKKKKSLIGLAIVLLLFIVVAIGYGIYYYVVNIYADNANEAALANPQTDSLAISNRAPVNSADTTISRKPDTINSVAVPAPPTASGQLRLRFIFEETRSRERALKRTGDLSRWGNNARYDSLSVAGAPLYMLYIPIAAFPADTARKKDSLQKHFGRTVKIIRE